MDKKMIRILDQLIDNYLAYPVYGSYIYGHMEDKILCYYFKKTGGRITAAEYEIYDAFFYKLLTLRDRY